MSRFDKVKKYYDNGYWTLEMVRNAVIKNWITEQQFKTITGQEY